MVVKVYKKTINAQERAERQLARDKKRKDKLTTDSFMNFTLQLGKVQITRYLIQLMVLIPLHVIEFY